MSAIPAETTAKKNLVLKVLDEMKAEEIVLIPLAGKTTLGDYMVIASGGSNRHVSAISDRVYEALKDGGYGTPRIEGIPACDWVLVDAGDVMVHIFRPEVRAFYNLEKIWGVERPDGLPAPAIESAR
ncbi:MAG: ribosome silencing factor [Methylobacteriaceae bacterium]|jgi:ribosome-associated protein|nr:ribosome silencing factor [Methylobacteriaceae bacterium]